jgi:hypothetical protein
LGPHFSNGSSGLTATRTAGGAPDSPRRPDRPFAPPRASGLAFVFTVFLVTFLFPSAVLFACPPGVLFADPVGRLAAASRLLAVRCAVVDRAAFPRTVPFT